MKITRKRLEQIIKEEINSVLLEESVQLEESFETIKRGILGAAMAAGLVVGAAPNTAQAKDVEVKVQSSINPNKTVTFTTDDVNLTPQQLKFKLDQELVDRFHSNEFQVIKIDGQNMIPGAAVEKAPTQQPDQGSDKFTIQGDKVTTTFVGSRDVGLPRLKDNALKFLKSQFGDSVKITNTRSIAGSNQVEFTFTK